ncbi:MAG: hypothetical protein KDG52_02395 [Rhodocyclaceae bacterium]|nr:hypothetical protein [Rhodocyclaceae bacterium]
MRLSVHFEAPADGGGSEAGPVSVGWLLSDPRGGVIYDAPNRVRGAERGSPVAKSASRCPAVLGLEGRLFEIRCPFDLSLDYVRDDFGRPAVRDRLGAASTLRPDRIDELIHWVEEDEWRSPERPTLQLALPYIFVADEPVYLSQLAPMFHYRAEPLPGLMLGGRFPIHVWPRPLMWAFEWHDTTTPLVLHRGEPLFYVQFETTPQHRAVQLVEAERTPELDEYLVMIEGAVSYVGQTFSLFKTAESRRPAHLLTPRRR